MYNFKKLYRCLSIALVFSLILSNCLQVSAAQMIKREKLKKSVLIENNNSDKVINDSIVIENNSTLTRRGNAVALYFVPGLGQVLITATGVVIVAGIVVVVGSWAYKQAIKYYSEHTKNKRKSTHDKHTKPRPGRDSEKKKNKNGWQKRK